MKALVIKKYGAPEELILEDVPQPVCKPADALVKVHAAGINPVDYKIRNGSLKFVFGRKFPKILGGEIAGVVEKAPASGKFKEGDRVFAKLDGRWGGYAEYSCVDENHLCDLPEEIGFNEGGAIPLAGLTALQSLRDLGKIKKGNHVLINGASGGVGHFGVQIAKYFGAEVTAVCSEKNAEWVRELGADRVVDYQQEDILKLDDQYDIFFDAVATMSPAKIKHLLKPKGIYVTTLPSAGLILQRIFNFLSSKKAFFILVKPSGKDLALISEMIHAGKFKPVIEKVFLLSQGPEAHKYIETGRVKGKTVFSM